ncbi:hypothetical protein SSX86_014025 [Deinandra increscens subsp. villosa]|uniref:Aconitase A/isopropylmalate dehydratase small subunit swivel domain-containing protein n=1 Tax=Deinandra increscens subsp. villosa TaxID=3103831 RepID=A0AAP0GZZ7_9ASTR
MAAATSFASPASFSSSPNHRFHHHHKPSPSAATFNSSKQPLFKPLISQSTLAVNPTVLRHASVVALATPDSSSSTSAASFHGTCYVVRDNIDTDQIIPAEYLTLVPSKPDEYKKLGSYALIGLPASYETRFVEPEQYQSKYSTIIAGDNFGCGSSREHAPVALGAAGFLEAGHGEGIDNNEVGKYLNSGLLLGCALRQESSGFREHDNISTLLHLLPPNPNKPSDGG